MTSNGKVRWGIIGAGNIAGKVAASLAGPDTSEVVAVASRDLSRAQAFASTHGIARACGDYDELLETANFPGAPASHPTVALLLQEVAG